VQRPTIASSHKNIQNTNYLDQMPSKSAEWSDGPICRTCYARAMRVRGSCSNCRADRLLPGLDTAGNPICRDCAGITRDFFCDRCGFEGLLLGGRLCERCTLADTLARLLNDGTGHVALPLQPLVTTLLETDRPKSRLIWLRNPNVVRLLRGLATGTIPLTHDGLHQETPWRTIAHLRDLLMDSGVLPRVDRQLMLYQRWLTERLASIEDPEHRRLLRHFATWHQVRRLRSKAEKGSLGRSQTSQAKQEITQADAFLASIADRGCTIEHCQQADLDAWHTEKLATRRPAQTFLRWCMKTNRMPRLTLPPQVIHQDQTPLHQHRRLTILRRTLNDDSLPLRARIAAALVLLYAQPVSRIVRLTVDDVMDDGASITVRLGDPPSPLPEPVANLMRAYMQSRQHLPYASSRSSQWLFPGRQPGQPMNPVSLQVHLREIGVPPQRGRTAAIRQLVLQAPAPVIAKALGYHDKTATRLVTEAGGTWSRYAPGDHTR
jgi:integrase